MGGQLHRDNINAQLSGFFSQGSTEGTVTGGSFAYTEEELTAVITNWRALADSYRTSLSNADRMTIVEGPGNEFASARQAAAANRSGDAYRAYLEHNRMYCERQAQLFQDALNDYLGVEHANVVDINKTDQQGPLPRI